MIVIPRQRAATQFVFKSQVSRTTSTTSTTSITPSSHPPSSSGTTITTVTGAGASILPPLAITGDQFAKIMDAIQATQSRLHDKLAAFQYQVCQSQK